MIPDNPVKRLMNERAHVRGDHCLLFQDDLASATVEHTRTPGGAEPFVLDPRTAAGMQNGDFSSDVGV